MAKCKLGDLQVNFEANPRAEKNSAAVLNYASAIREYQSQGVEFHKAWEQPIEVTSDKIVVRGSHTVLALREVHDEDYEVEVRYAKINGKQAKGLEDAKWLSAQSNKKGIEFGDGEVTNALNFMLDQMNPTKDEDIEGKRPFLADRPLSAAVGCSRSMANKVRKKWLKKNGYAELVEERKTGTEEEKKGKSEPLTEEQMAESQQAAEKILKEQEQKKEEAKRSKERKVDAEQLQEDIDDLNNFDSSEDGDEELQGDTHPFDREPANTVTPVDEDDEGEVVEEKDPTDLDFSGEEEEEPDDEEEENSERDRRRHKKQFEEHIENFIAAQPDPLLYDKIEVLIDGKDVTDQGILRPLLGDCSPEEIDIVIDLFKWIMEVMATEAE